MKIVSWNVNGLRACAKKGFCGWLDACDAHIIGVQEVRALEHQITPELRPASWFTHFVAALGTMTALIVAAALVMVELAPPVRQAPEPDLPA